jgi:hypothetical protein
MVSLIASLSDLGAGIRRVVSDINADQAGQPFRTRADYYALQERYYTNTVFERLDAATDAYKAWYGLPRHIRPIYNPTRRAVDWYTRIYRGAWTADGLPDSTGRANRLGYDRDTPEPLRLAVQQFFSWGNWGSELLAYVRTGAMLGDAFAEIEVNAERRKLYPRLVHPRYVTDLAFNAAGDVVMYRLDIPQYDQGRKQGYTWGKVVTKETITTLRNGEPAGYDGAPAAQPNPWGFVPAVWVQHRNVGGQHGAPAIDGVHGKIDELNGIAAAIDDYIAQFVKQGVVLKTDKPVKEIQAIATSGQTHTMNDPRAGRETIKYLKGPADLALDHLIQNLGLGEAAVYVDKLIEEIEKDLPEIVMDEQLRHMSQVTGPGAARLMSDVEGKYDEAQTNYDAGVIKLGQMGVSIGGWLATTGQWGPRSQLTEAQRAFVSFDLTSYDRGELAFSLVARPLIPKTLGELATEATAMEAVKTPAGLRHLGASDEEIYGEGNVPATLPGLLAERESAAGGTADLLSRAFNAGL